MFVIVQRHYLGNKNDIKLFIDARGGFILWDGGCLIKHSHFMTVYTALLSNVTGRKDYSSDSYYGVIVQPP